MKSTAFLIFFLILHTFKEATFANGQVSTSAAEKEQDKINTLKSNKRTYTIEIFVIVDHASYKRWFELSARDPQETLSTIKLHFALVINEVRRFYEQISLPGIWLTCALVGYYVEDKPSNLNFMNEVQKGRSTINGTYAAELFYKWFLKSQKSKEQVTPKFDVAIIYTGLDLSVGNSFGNIGTACTTKGISVVRDGDFFSTAYATAQRIANNFGVKTDGLSGCSDADSFIMSANEGGKNINNFFKFSKCSRLAFKNYFKELNRKNQNCLLNSPKRKNLGVIQNMKEFPGMEYSHDVQCLIAYGPYSYKCPDIDLYGDRMCVEYNCWNQDKLKCLKVIPADGTPCDDKKWCFRKKCVPDKRAPSLDENCRFGDYSGVIETDDGLLTCPELTQHPDYCYDQMYSLYCCKSCSSFADETPPVKDKDSEGNKQVYTVEIFVLVDHSSYEKWFQLSNKDRKETLSTMNLYFAYVINEAKRVYEEVNLPGIRITCALVGYYIEHTPSNLKFINKSKIERDKINDTYAGELFYEWILKDRKSKTRITPDFDVAILFTGYKMLTGDGYGYFKSVCTAKGIAIVRDTNFFFTTHTVVHEIGHTLGVHHDGNIGCKDVDSYIMSATKLGQNKKNLFKFSRCSLSALKSYLNELNRKKQNCLLNPPKRESQNNTQHLKAYPGLEFTHDEQCLVAYGPYSFMCPGDKNYGNNMCEQVYCWNQDRNSCWGLTLADGTPCDDKKWCIRKKCVPDKRAPSLDAKCRFGDYGGVIETSEGLLTCPEIAKYPKFCEEELYKSSYCCKSCSTVVSQTQKTNNEKTSYQKVTCDEPDWCAKQPFVNCYDLNDTCCRTCQTKLNSSRPDCMYGDHLSWCSDLNNDVCKDPYTKKECCQSCQ